MAAAQAALKAEFLRTFNIVNSICCDCPYDAATISNTAGLNNGQCTAFFPAMECILQPHPCIQIIITHLLCFFLGSCKLLAGWLN
jgi:hypothetical protein